MRRFEPADYPIYLHTQPGSFRAIKLFMPNKNFERLTISETPGDLIRLLENDTTVQF
jgi:hypothetical protein